MEADLGRSDAVEILGRWSWVRAVLDEPWVNVEEIVVRVLAGSPVL
jgi:hypothetical protein